MKEEKKGKEANTNKVKSAVIVSVMLFSVLAVISLSVAVLNPGQHQFYGNVTVDGCSAPDGTNVTAKIGAEICGSQTTVNGKYGYATAFYVEGNDGENITFWVDGVFATNYTFSTGAETDLDLDVPDESKPVVINPNANKSVVADGKDTVRLNVTAKDHFRGKKPSVGVDTVTIDLTPIIGVVAYMSNTGNCTEDDALWCIFSNTTSVPTGTPPGTYHLTVNATDPSGNYNDTVNITLEVTTITCGDVAPYPDGDGIVNMGDVARLLSHVGNPSEFPVDEWAGDCKCTGTINMGDVALLLSHVGNPEEFPLECC